MSNKVLMLPVIDYFKRYESGIKQVIINYAKYLPEFGYEITKDQVGQFDLLAAHAGAHPNADVAHIHGLYWSADYNVMRYEHRANRDVINTIRHAKQVTVPSPWVAETIARDMRFMPTVIPHGIDWQDWRHNRQVGEYVLWNKNRNLDVCSPYYVGVLAKLFPKRLFVSTFAPTDSPSPNVRVTGVLPHGEMRSMIQSAAVYLNTTKETFGIGILEAMASGVPVLAFNQGGAADLIEHGVTGYLATPGSVHDLQEGLDYCYQYRDRLGANAIEAVKKWDWRSAVEKVARVYDAAMQNEPTSVSVIIPTYNYADKVGRAIESAINQTYKPVDIVVVDDGSTDNTEEIVKDIIRRSSSEHIDIRYIKQENAGVAIARNLGLLYAGGKYACCLDADDAIQPLFLEVCIRELERDRSLGIAYTGLTFIKPSGETGVSPWPGEFDYDMQIAGRNQIPTCCVFRKEMWQRLGGYRQRYAPSGAGSEDAEFWLRAGAYGWGAKKVTDAGLFMYSWLSGRVSGNPEYSEVDWRAWHPWIEDNQHPFASIATPINGIAHSVRSYDEPEVSVVIPVGEGHEKEIINALDSLEAQTFRKWEAIVVWDSPESPEETLTPYPYIHLVRGGGGWGAGRARNEGAAIARASLLLFLDADDWLYPEAIEKMVEAFNIETSVIYTDYVGKAFIAKEDLSKIDNKVLYYNERIGEAVISYRSAEYDCERAVRQPDEKTKDTYIWNLITSLVPKAWHDEIGGFDEDMPSWEDWDYWIRMARAGRCFVRLPEQLVVYRFYTGHRRDTGLQSSQTLLKYMIDKKEKAEIMGCGCKKSKTTDIARRTTIRVTAQSQRERENIMAQDENLVLCIYQHPNKGDHKVIGPATRTVYGYRGGGTRFYVHKSDIAAAPDLFVPINVMEERRQQMAPPPPPPPPPAPSDEYEEEVVFDLQSLPGITPQIAMGLNAMGAHTPEDVLELGVEGLSRIKGIGEKRAEAILAFIEEQQQEE